MTIRELVRGPGDQNAPAAEGPWLVIGAKTEGVSPGFRIQDKRGRKYLLKFDPSANPEMATGADVVVSKFLYALGYNVPENYIVTFERAQLKVDPKLEGRHRITEKQVNAALSFVRKDRAGKYRAVASLLLEGKPLGPFSFYGVREDDPNDRIPHEHRRSLRGLYVMSAWLHHTDSKAGNTLDMLVSENGVRFVRHHLIDFGTALGSASSESKSARQGYEYLLDVKPAIVQALTFGLLVPKWARVKTPALPSVGRFEAEAFDPHKWKPNFQNAAFANRLPEDEAWAASKVTAFRTEEIRAIVETGQYSDPRAVDWITKVLAERRDKIGRAMLSPAKVVRRRGD
jgi:hypothetical protein